MPRKSLRKERAEEYPELVRALHHLGVAGGGKDGEPAVGKEVEHLGGVVESDEVAVAVLIPVEGSEMIIHAVAMRPGYRRLLDP